MLYEGNEDCMSLLTDTAELSLAQNHRNHAADKAKGGLCGRLKPSDRLGRESYGNS